ncbi:hypothetical protein ACFE04_002164 [Oxalis oulophora]
MEKPKIYVEQNMLGVSYNLQATNGVRYLIPFSALGHQNVSAVEKMFWYFVRLVADKEANKPRGYGFIEYMHTRDMKVAYKQGDGKKIDGRRVLVDVERGRTVPNWRPRRLGGGLGTTRVRGEDISQREQPPSGPFHSEEPRTREDRLGERDVEKPRDRRESRDRDREREKSRELSHDRPRDRDHKEDKHHRDRDKDRERGKSYDRVESKRDHRDYDHEQPEHGHRRSSDRDHYEHRDKEIYDPMDVHGDDDRYDQYADQDNDRYHQTEEDDYRYESRQKERDYK